MNKYAVGVCDFNSGTHEVKVVKAPHAMQAIVNAVGQPELWGIGGEYPFYTMEGVIDWYLQGDVSVTEPIKL